MFIGVKGKLRQLDIYRKLPSDLTETTTVGALISIISTFLMITLFFTEIKVIVSFKIILGIYRDKQFF